jgi:hypothetical protein
VVIQSASKPTATPHRWPFWAALAALAVDSTLVVVALTRWRVPLDFHFCLPWIICFVVAVVLVLLAVVAKRKLWKRMTSNDLARLALLVAMLMVMKVLVDALRARSDV